MSSVSSLISRIEKHSAQCESIRKAILQKQLIRETQSVYSELGLVNLHSNMSRILTVAFTLSYKNHPNTLQSNIRFKDKLPTRPVHLSI